MIAKRTLMEPPTVSEHAVKDIFGHANIKTTSTYLATRRTGLHEQ